MTQQGDDPFESAESRRMAFTADQLWYLASAVHRGVSTTLHTAEDAFAMLKAIKPAAEVARNDVGEPVAPDFGTQRETLRTMLVHQLQWLLETTSALDVGWRNEWAWSTLVGSVEDLHDRFYGWLDDERKDRELLALLPEQEPAPRWSSETSERFMVSVLTVSRVIAERMGLELRESTSGLSGGRMHFELSFETGDAGSAGGSDSEGN